MKHLKMSENPDISVLYFPETSEYRVFYKTTLINTNRTELTASATVETIEKILRLK